MHDYNTILGVIELRLSKVSYDAVQKRYRIGRSGIALIMNRYNDSGLSLDDLRQMPASKVVDLIYPKENLRHKDIPLPDFEKISGLMDTVSIKKNIKHSKKAIKSSINKNTTKVKNMQKKIKDTKKVKNTVSKYVIVSINSNNIFEPSNVSTKTLKNALEGTNLKELAPAFVKAEKKYGINAIAMTSIAALESGWGKSKRAVKDNNLTGLGVYSDSAKGINADTKEKNILMTAERLATHYSKPGQTFYHGTGFDGVNKKYSASKTWGWKCENIAFRIMNKIANPGIESLG